MDEDDIVERLRSLADEADDVPLVDLEQRLRDPADTIELLRAELGRMSTTTNKALQGGFLPG